MRSEWKPARNLSYELTDRFLGGGFFNWKPLAEESHRENAVWKMLHNGGVDFQVSMGQLTASSVKSMDYQALRQIFRATFPIPEEKQQFPIVAVAIPARKINKK